MIRRPPTAIKLTKQEVLQYEESKRAHGQSTRAPQPGPLGTKSKEERIGLPQRPTRLG